MKNYIEEVLKCKPNMIYIDLDCDTLQRIDGFTRAVISAKRYEYGHRIDSGQEYKRFFTGMMGECAVEKLFGVQFIDWSVGNSNLYNNADMTAVGLNAGIKTVELNKFPVIHKRAYRAELICIKRSPCTVILCGLATIDVLNSCQDDSLILSPYLRRKGTKTGFYGFGRLIPVHSLEDVRRHSGFCYAVKYQNR